MRTFETIKEEIKLIDHEIINLTGKRNNLELELQETCDHPKKARCSTGAGETCLKCEKILRFPHDPYDHIGNLF